MMNIQQLLRELDKRSISLEVSNSELKLRAPKGAASADLVAAIRHHKEALVARLVAGDTRRLQIQPSAERGRHPATDSQERLWFLQQLSPESVDYNVVLAFRAEGVVDEDCVEKTLQHLCRRHEALRTHFEYANDGVEQVVAPELQPPLTWIDVSGEPDPQAACDTVLSKSQRRPFALDQVPLWRCVGVRVSDQAYTFCVTLHHSVTDGWSIQLFLSEWLQAYDALVSGRALDDKTVPLQPGDYARWEKGLLAQGGFEARAQSLSASIATLEPLQLPAPRTAAPPNQPNGERVRFGVAEPLRAGLEKVGATSGCTFYTVMVAAWGLLLSRYCGQAKVVMGTNLANRDSDELQSVFGFLANTLVLHCEIEPHKTFRELLQETRPRVASVLDSAAVPLTAVLPKRGGSRDVALRTALVYLNLPELKEHRAGSVTWQAVDRLDITHEVPGTAKWDICLNLGASDSGLRAEIVYRRTAVDDATAQRLAGQLQQLFEAIVAAPDRPVSELCPEAVPQISARELDAQRQYWQSRLAGTQPLRFPEDHVRADQRTRRGTLRQEPLEAQLSAALRERAQTLGVPTEALGLSALAMVLRRYCSQDDVPIAMAVAPRDTDPAASSLPLWQRVMVRCDLTGNPGLAALVERVGHALADAQRHRDLPYADAIAALVRSQGEHRDPTRACFYFDSACVVGEDALAADLDLVVSMQDVAGGITLGYCFDSGLFEAETLERFAGYLRRALQALAHGTDATLDEIELLAPEERARLLATCFPVPHPACCIHDEISARAQEFADDVALASDAGNVTYRELEAKAGQLAHTLVAHGIQPDELVGVFIERSLFAPLAFLGVLKASAAYVPIDVDYPTDRVAYILRDAGARWVITTRALRARLPPEVGNVICIDALLQEPPSTSASSLPRTRPDGLAYVMYTSGSTGRPKGVMIEHAQVANLFASMDRLAGIERRGVWLAATSFSFDVSIPELWWALARGCKVVIAEDRVRKTGESVSGANLPEQLRRYGATYMLCTPSRAQLLLEHEDGPAALGQLDLLVLAGEVLPPGLAERLRQTGVRRLFNAYGPTETTVYVTMHPVSEVGESVSIGSGFDNTRLYVLDAERRLLPTGAVGELYVGGDPVARGYWNRPELTQERFVADPFCGESGARMYRTGDLVRYGSGMLFDYIGRTDHQVKLRGYRIELGEVEAALLQCANVRQAVVVLRKLAEDDQQLVAYCAFDDGCALDAAELKRQLRRQLPDYMIPSQFVVLTDLELNVSGKIDRDALPTRLEPTQAAERVLPRSETERCIAEVWMRALRCTHVGLDDGFFDLGGHSLLMAKVRAELSQALGRSIPLIALFEHPTIRALAQYLSGSTVPAAPSAPELGHAPEAAAGSGDIAIIGMAGRFPGARDSEEFWKNLCDGVCSISRFDEAELSAHRVDSTVFGSNQYVPCKGVLEDAEYFDAEFFGFTPKDAELTDPQHRVLLECSWQAFEDAGYDPSRFPGRTGVFVGAGHNSYLYHVVQMDGAPPEEPMRILLHNEKDFLATRISHRLNLRGPSVALQTACSTSLVAIHYACKSLLDGESDMALAGGVSISFPLKGGYEYQPSSIQSPDGVCRPFDAAAAGTVFSNGAGVVMLRRVEDALQSGDRIYAVIKGSAVNNDGASKVGFAAPSIEGQTAVISEALRRARVAPESIEYIEAHGTATALGDPIEVQALGYAFRGSKRERPRLIGSLKSNMGHLDAAAGVAGLIKAAFCVGRGVIPASLHFDRENPHIDFAELGIRVCSSLTAWPSADGPRRAGVSSFGIGGTNAHIVVEAPPPRALPEPSMRTYHVVPISARTAQGCASATGRLRDSLLNSTDDLADVAFTLQTGRHQFAARVAAVASATQQAAQALAEPGACRVVKNASQRLTFVCSGADRLDQDVIDQLIAAEPMFRREFEACAAAIRDACGVELLANTSASGSPTFLSAVRGFALGWAQARFLEALGVRPTRCVGHASGTSLAALLAGDRSLDEALRDLANHGETALPSPMPTLSSSELAIPIGAGPVALAAALDRVEPLALAAPLGAGLAQLLAALWVRGIDVSWSALYASERRMRVALPAYPFERRRYSLLSNAARSPKSQPARAVNGAPSPQLETGASASTLRQAETELERRLVEVWQQVLGRNIGLDDDFFDIGGDSFLAVELGSKLQAEVHPKVTVELVIENPSVARLSEVLQALDSGGDVKTIHAGSQRRLSVESCVLPPEISAEHKAFSKVEPRRVLLTGVTGYLGPFLVRALLDEMPDTQLICIVRADDIGNAWSRLEGKLRDAQLWSAADAHRITAIPGDLAAPRLGLDERLWARLTQDVDAIVHGGATVHFAMPFERLYPSNVYGTETILRLATEGKLKPVHHLSTLAVFETREVSDRVIDEQTELDTKVKLVHGYAESKLAAEQLVWEASRRGVPVAVYRPGGVTGHTASGISNTGDILSRMIRGVAELGRCPEGDAPLDMVPVDYVAQAVAVGVRTCSVGTRPYHLTHPEPCRWADVLQAIQTKGFPVTKVSMPDWRRIVNDEIGANKQGVLFPLLPLLQASSVGEKVEVVMMQFKCSDTARRLDHAGVRCPTLSPQILDRYLQFFVDTGYLPQCA